MIPDAQTLTMLQLSLTPGLGPVLLARALRELGSYDAIIAASETALRRVKGIGPDRARSIAAGLADAPALAVREMELCHAKGVTLVAFGAEGYPPLLAQIPSPPIVLYVRGDASVLTGNPYSVAIVGSRECSAYGLEQASRFSMALAQAGLTIVSGGARGIDTAAHTAAVRVAAAGARTVVVTGCGLGHVYPPENARLFDQIIESGAGCVVSELPLATPPSAENFPARNRIISGLSLGVLIVEAARRSGALITARQAIEEHNREVFAVPGRIDSAFSAGCLDLIKSGGAALVTHPDDVLSALETPARHVHGGTHGSRYAASSEPAPGIFNGLSSNADAGSASPQPAAGAGESNGSVRDAGLSAGQRAILTALAEAPHSFDELIKRLATDPSTLRADVTLLEIKRRVRRAGSRLEIAGK